MGRPVIKVVVLIASAIVTVAVFAVAPIAFFNQAAPSRIDRCGRHYYPGSGTLTMPQVQTELARNGERGLAEIGTTSSGEPIVTNASSGCSMVLYVQTGPDSYVPYVLSGGP